MRRVLLVDDDPDVLDALGTALEPWFEVVLASNATQALDALGKQLIDAVVLDLMMPGMDTNEFMRECAARHLVVPVIAASARQDIALRCTEAGIHRWVQKPFRIAALRAHLDAVCGS